MDEAENAVENTVKLTVTAQQAANFTDLVAFIDTPAKLHAYVSFLEPISKLAVGYVQQADRLNKEFMDRANSIRAKYFTPEVPDVQPTFLEGVSEKDFKNEFSGLQTEVADRLNKAKLETLEVEVSERSFNDFVKIFNNIDLTNRQKDGEGDRYFIQTILELYVVLQSAGK